MASKQQLAQWCSETFGLTPLEVLMRIATNPENDVRVQQAAAANAASYVHPKLRQVELIDNTSKSREQLEHDVNAILERHIGRTVPGSVVATIPPGTRDLIG